jgi:hypothetical protein
MNHDQILLRQLKQKQLRVCLCEMQLEAMSASHIILESISKFSSGPHPLSRR